MLLSMLSLMLIPGHGEVSNSLPVPSFRDGFSSVASTAVNGVVNISTTWHAGHSEKRHISPFDNILEEFFQQTRPSGKRTSLGSGFLVRAKDKAGREKIVVVTNFHVVRNVHRRKGRIHVALNSGKNITATVMGWDAHLDIAVLSIDTKEPLYPLTWGQSSGIKVGHWALAIGNPFGLGGTFTAGVVSHTQRVLESGAMGHDSDIDRWIQTDTPINQGSSGGALLNIDGHVIGMNSAILTSTGGNVGVALAIPEAIVRPAVEQLVRHGAIHRGFLGVQMGLFIDDATAQSLGVPEGVRGVVVDDVARGKSAEKSGLKRGDVIVRINKTPIKSILHLRSMVGSIRPGSKLSMDIWRPDHDGNGVHKRLILVADKADHDWGLPQTLQSRRLFKSEKSVEIEEVQKLEGGGLEGIKGPFVRIKDSRRDKNDLRKGDIILSINHRPVHSVAECLDALSVAAESPDRKQVFFYIARPIGYNKDGIAVSYIKQHVPVRVRGWTGRDKITDLRSKHKESRAQ